MESLEGKRGVPRIRPPFPAVVGLWGGRRSSTTPKHLPRVPHILLMGGAGYRRDRYAEEWRYATVLHERERREAGRVRTADGLQPQEDDL